MIRTDNLSEIDSAVAQTVEGAIDPAFVADFARAPKEGAHMHRRVVWLQAAISSGTPSSRSRA
jgi:hypothetical protein